MKTRPPKVLDVTDYKKIESLSGYGVRLESIAIALGVSTKTLHNIMKRDKKAKAAYEEGKAKVETMATKNIYEAIKRGNLTATFFYLKTQCRWKETQDLEISEGSLKPFKFKRKAG